MVDNHHRKHGIYYTPSVLADYLAAPLINDVGVKILDPAYGEGALLLAAERQYHRKFPKSSLHLFGCDIKPVNGLLKHLPEANLKKINFFEYPSHNKFPVILMNPPYVRHHLQSMSTINRFRSNFPELSLLERSADMWAYFIKQLIKLTRADYRKCLGFLNNGRSLNVHETAHSLRRDPWYSVTVGPIPDAFFPYRISKNGFLALNKRKIQCTNSIHRIYFKNLTRIEKKWVQLSLLSYVGQLSLEVHSKTYGRGMLKIEPSSLKRTLVLKRKDRSINSVFTQVMAELKKNNKERAVEIATDFINAALNIPKDMSIKTKQALASIQDLRLSSK